MSIPIINSNMRLFEITKHYYHGSKKLFSVGLTLTPMKDGYAESDDEDTTMVENILNKYKPSLALSRQDSIFMVDTPDPDLIEKMGGYADHIYEVIPAGTVYKNDLRWYGELSSIIWKEDDMEAKKLALGYWSGKSFDGNPHFEYRAKSATINKEVS
jgi:hypothetical protein